MPKKLALAKVSTKLARPAAAGLLAEVRGLILGAREQVARAVDSGLVTLYWHIGRRIHQDILKGKRAEYGAKIVSALGRQLEAEFGRGFSEKSLRHMVRFAEVFPDEQIVAALRRQLGWTHFKAIIYLDDELKRDFYAEMCRIEKWSTRTMAKKIGGMLYERTALSKKPDQLIRQELAALREEDKLTPDLVFRDPYVLDFLGLRDTYAERDFEVVILREFKPADKGQMELYLRWLDRHERKPGEEAPVGLILCAGQRRETVELLDLEKSGIRVSSYWTDLMPKGQLQKKLHQAVRLARARWTEKTNKSPRVESKRPR